MPRTVSPYRVIAGLPLILALALAGCGGSSPEESAAAPAASAADDKGGSSSVAAAPSSDTGSGEDGGNSGDGGSDAADAEALLDSLAPPNAEETSRSTAGGGVLATWESTDSLESMISFYEQAIPGAGLEITSSFTPADGASWTFDSGNFHGSVTLIESAVNSGGTNVSISVLDTSV